MDTDDDTPAFAKSLGAMYGSSPETSEDEEETNNIVCGKPHSASFVKTPVSEGFGTVSVDSETSVAASQEVDTSVLDADNTEDKTPMVSEETSLPIHETENKNSVLQCDQDPELSSVVAAAEITNVEDTLEPEGEPASILTESCSELAPDASSKFVVSEPEIASEEIKKTVNDESLHQDGNELPKSDTLQQLDDNKSPEMHAHQPSHAFASINIREPSEASSNESFSMHDVSDNSQTSLPCKLIESDETDKQEISESPEAFVDASSSLPFEYDDTKPSESGVSDSLSHLQTDDDPPMPSDLMESEEISQSEKDSNSSVPSKAESTPKDGDELIEELNPESTSVESERHSLVLKAVEAELQPPRPESVGQEPSTQSDEISSQSSDLESIIPDSAEASADNLTSEQVLPEVFESLMEEVSIIPSQTRLEVMLEGSIDSHDSSESKIRPDGSDCTVAMEKVSNIEEVESSSVKKKDDANEFEHLTMSQEGKSESRRKQKPSSGKASSQPLGGRRLRQIRHPSVKAAEAAADAAFVAAVTPTRKNLKEAKIACAIANVSDSADINLLTKKSTVQSSAPRSKKIRPSSIEPTLLAPADSSGVYIDETSTSDKILAVEGNEKMSSKVCHSSEETSDISDESVDASQFKVGGEPTKLMGIKLKISKESVQILDPNLKKLEVQIPSDVSEVTSATPSPGGSKKSRKAKDELTSGPSLSPITLKIAKSKEGLEVVPGDGDSLVPDSEGAKVEKITLKISKDDSASIVKQGTSWEENQESRAEKQGIKGLKDDLKIDENEEMKLKKITLKLSKDDGACIIKKKDSDNLSSAESDCGKLERITLKLSPGNNVSIVRDKDISSFESNSNSVDCGKVEKITLKVTKNDNVCIVKPSSPVPPVSGVEKLTLKVSKDGTAAVTGKSRDDSPSSRDNDGSKLEKITLKFSKDDGVSIVKPVSPTPEKLSRKVLKDEPLSPLSPLTISRTEELEPQKERITLKLSKAGGHPSPVGTLDERSSWSIKSVDTEGSPSGSECITPKSKPKRTLTDPHETAPSKKIKLSEMEKSNDSGDITIMETDYHSDKEDSSSVEAFAESDVAPKRIPDNIEPEDAKKIKLEDTEASQPQSVWPSAGKVVEVVDIDSEDSQSAPCIVAELSADQKVPVVDLEDGMPSSGVVKRKPRGRPRKSVLTPGAIPSGTLPCSPDTSGTRKTAAKLKKEKALVEPRENDRPKRSCKGREKPPPKPPKPVKPRGRNAAAAKQAAFEEVSSPNTMTVEAPQLFEEETRMSADCGSRSQTPAPGISSMSSNGLQMTPKVMIPRLSVSSLSMHSTPSATPAQSPGPQPLNDESQSSLSMVSSTTTTTESTPNKGNRKGRMEISVDPEAKVEYTVEMIAEYVWPIAEGRAGETYMIQEQISEFLKVKSFKRKYPNMLRRPVDHDERQYLLEKKLVSESLCDMGLTAVPSHEVLDVMCTDFTEKYEEYRRHTREKAARELSNKQKALVIGTFSGKEDPKSKAMRNMANFNTVLNRSRREHRRCCFDLQTFSVHYPEERRRRMTVQNIPPIGAYPLALVPGQYTDFFKEYTATELRYFPLNTVLYGPLLPHETMKMHGDGGSDGSQTDTSDSSSSDGSSSDSGSSGSESDSDSGSSSESEDEASNQIGAGAAPAESQDVDTDRPDAICRICNGDRLKNKAGRAEPLVHCANCTKSGHPSCLDLTVDMVPHIKKYAWQCTDCKLCAQCNDTADEDKMLFCDMCDRGYHIYCVGLRKVPEGRWHCRECAMCASCGARNPGGNEEQQAATTQAAQDTPTKVEIPQWQHEFKKGDKGTRIYVRTLCVPCSKLWRKGRYCRLCWKCYGNQPEEEGLINCSICDRWMHADCCRKAGRVIDMDKLGSFLCELCQQKGVLKSPSKPYRP